LTVANATVCEHNSSLSDKKPVLAPGTEAQ
jgi:hypothetical protein